MLKMNPFLSNPWREYSDGCSHASSIPWSTGNKTSITWSEALGSGFSNPKRDNSRSHTIDRYGTTGSNVSSFVESCPSWTTKADFGKASPKDRKRGLDKHESTATDHRGWLDTRAFTPGHHEWEWPSKLSYVIRQNVSGFRLHTEEANREIIFSPKNVW